MTYITEARYQLDFNTTSDNGELQTAEGYADDVTNATSGMVLGGEGNSLLTLTDTGLTLSTTASDDSINFLSAVRFDLPEELKRRYRGWRS
jgi:hypothetical protein